MSMKKVDISTLDLNPFAAIGKDWALVTAGNAGSYNTMTVSWGGMGVIWGKNVFTAVIRPQRYTFEFIEREEYFTVSFFGGEQREALSFCGSHSGRDYDKAKETGLTPVEVDGTVGFSEAKLTLVCKKLYRHQLEKKDFLDNSNDKWYDNDYHYAYVGEICAAYVKE